jgi:hypothetical protein
MKSVLSLDVIEWMKFPAEAFAMEVSDDMAACLRVVRVAEEAFVASDRFSEKQGVETRLSSTPV